MSLHKAALQQEVLDNKHYTTVPNKLMEAVQGNTAAFMVWVYIFGQAEGWQPSIRQIMRGTHLAQHTVKSAIEFLCGIGWLDVVVQDKGKKSLYILKLGKSVAEIDTPSVAETATLQYEPIYDRSLYDGTSGIEDYYDNWGGAIEKENLRRR